ncbi:unnamed protein product, partial [marine sediment metagenome]
GHFKKAILEWQEARYSRIDIQAWNVFAGTKKVTASGFNMFTRFRIAAGKEGKTWTKLKNCVIYDVNGDGFKVDINVAFDFYGKLYLGTSKFSMLKEFNGTFDVNKYTFEVNGLSKDTKYYFYIKNTSIGEGARTGIYSKRTTLKIPIIIDIGLPAIDRASSMLAEYTNVNRGNPANESGKIKTVEIWAYETLTNCKVATFFIVSGNYLTARDVHTIGKVPGGSKQTFSGLDIEVEAGDMIGIFYTTGKIERSTSGYSGMYYQYGDHTTGT